MKQSQEFPIRRILELSCSAQRTLGRYIKENEVWMNQFDPKITPTDLPNKWLIKFTLGMPAWTDRMPPKDLVVIDEDKKLADNIELYYRRFAFSAITDNNSFESTVFTLLNSQNVSESNIGFIACLPSKYKSDISRQKVKKHSRTCDTGFLGETNSWINDCDAEILEIFKSNNYDAFNVTALINNKMCSWMTKNNPTLGAAVVVKAKIKEHSKHWLYGNDVTRLNYVKVAQ